SSASLARAPGGKHLLCGCRLLYGKSSRSGPGMLPSYDGLQASLERHADQFGDLGGTCLLIEIDASRLKDIEPFSDITKKPSVVHNAKLATLGHHIYREFA